MRAKVNTGGRKSMFSEFSGVHDHSQHWWAITHLTELTQNQPARLFETQHAKHQGGIQELDMTSDTLLNSAADIPKVLASELDAPAQVLKSSICACDSKASCGKCLFLFVLVLR